MAHYLLIYDLAPDYLERRAAFREAHLALAWRSVERGDLLLGGALADPAAQAMLLFQGEGPEAAETFAQDDPYVAAGLVTRWRVHRWTTVVGADASTPVHPNDR
ncbi:YciI-like protein [Sphingomonas sp. HF-S3]|uniref:YciI-like protein n=1 Tax=Sphingomonas rustica TaxID=3103142 RepID=A0ABV0B7X4_9SPHN